MSTKKKTTYRSKTTAQLARAERQRAYRAAKAEMNETRRAERRRLTPHAEVIAAMKSEFLTRAERRLFRSKP
jgi:hypothetical protein